MTNMCGAPIVMATLLNTLEADKRALPGQVKFIVAGAPPPEAVLAAMKAAGFAVCHVYGLTEVYGPAVVNEWHAGWNARPAPEQAALMARQGAVSGARRPRRHGPADDGAGARRWRDARRGHVQCGDEGLPEAGEAATAAAFKGGWFHTGDLFAVKYPDGYIQLKDRSKDIIISGGENILLHRGRGRAVQAPRRVGGGAWCADEKWGETPCALSSWASVPARPPSRA